MEQQMINITMLGEFAIRVGEHEVSENTGRTKQVWNLVEYLLANRFKVISQERLIEILWPGDSSDNPANALKNLVYRLRTILKSGVPGCDYEFVLYHRGAYSWNNDLPCTVDTEEMESLWKQAKAAQDEDEQQELYQRAIACYKGNFLPKSAYEEWVIPVAEYYRRIYLECINGAVPLMMVRGRYDEIVTICEHAMTFDPFDEKLYEFVIRAMAASGKQSKALAHYEYVCDLFYKELGVKPSENIRSLYQEIIQNIKSVETDLHTIKDDLREGADVEGAFCCEYEIFKNLYRLEARAAARSGQTVFVALLTVSTPQDGVPQVRTLTQVMNLLQEVSLRSLRKGDVVSRFSGTQFVLMLPTMTFENGEVVLKRILENFYRRYKGPSVKIHTKLQPLDPVEMQL
ncbi:MAG: BTAD domain-containing putative transcriptional regulator [Oscillospiraceae bacterium]|nr:BTAD domain-containing putative transcriptional regulator [Oscillospiraceae bacterium]